MKTTTRSQLKGYGVSRYHAFVITKALTPIGKENRANTYALEEVISSLKEYLKRPRIKPKTLTLFESVLSVLFDQLDNIRKVPFVQATDPNLSKLSKRLYYSLLKTEDHFSTLVAMGAAVKGKDK